MAAGVDPQQGMFDREVEDGDLIAALEKREKTRAAASAAKAKHTEQHDKVKAMIDAYDLGDEEVVRAGRFRIRMSRREGGTPVSFTTAPGRRKTISLLDDDE